MARVPGRWCWTLLLPHGPLTLSTPGGGPGWQRQPRCQLSKPLSHPRRPFTAEIYQQKASQAHKRS